MATSPVVTRKGSKSNVSSPFPTLSDFKKLLLESEDRILNKLNAKIDTLIEKVTALDAAILDVKAVQVQQEIDIAKIKDVITNQQRQIEACDERLRGCNLIISNLPESKVTFKQEALESDKEKVRELFNEILPPDQEVFDDDLCEVVRIGRPGRNSRALKVKLSSEKWRNNILRCGRNLNSDSIRSAFGRIYINKDLSFLRRQEEKRLREKRKELKEQYPDADVRIRSGKLYLGPAIRDSVNICNQLF